MVGVLLLDVVHFFLTTRQKRRWYIRRRPSRPLPIEKRVGEYVLKRGEMALGCHLCARMNVFTMETLRSNGVLKKDIKLLSTGFVDNLWDEVPGDFKKIRVFKSMTKHYEKKHEGEDLPPVLRKGTKGMKERKRQREEPTMVWTNMRGFIQETAVRRSQHIKKRRGDK